MVFVYHNRKYWRDQLHPEILRLFGEFHIGVALFFVLSGFLIAYTYSDEPMRSGKAYTRYMLLRLARIMPLYWLLLTAYYLDPVFGKREFSWLTYSLFHGFSDKHNLDGIAQAWSLTVEMSFYCLAPLLCLLQRKHILYLLAALLVLFGSSWAGGELWHRVNGNPERFFYPLQFILTGTFSGRFTEFLAGMLLAMAIRNSSLEVTALKKLSPLWVKKIPYKTTIGFTGIFVTAYCIGLFQSNLQDDGVDHMGGILLQKIALPFFVLLSLAGLIYERTWLQRFFASRLLVLLGNASFAFYLVHISYVNLKARQYIYLPDRNFILLWLVAIVLYLVFEKPIYDRCRKWLK